MFVPLNKTKTSVESIITLVGVDGFANGFFVDHLWKTLVWLSMSRHIAGFSSGRTTL